MTDLHIDVAALGSAVRGCRHLLLVISGISLAL
jgi:hypothetical protein